MIFEINDHGNPSFTGIHPLMVELLRAVALDPWERCPEGCERLLPSPGEDEDLRLDWEDHVQPELRRHFDAERAVVAGDLERIASPLENDGKGDEEGATLEIPLAHAEAWLTTLNALRLALVGEHRFTEADLSHESLPDLSDARGIALMQVNFYAFIQECLVRCLDGEGGEGE
jgi:hypothetical protein